MEVKNNTAQVLTLVDGQILNPFGRINVDSEDNELLEQINSLSNLGLISIV